MPPPPVVIELWRRLLQRYGLLFRGRRLVCRGCLGVRYGEVKGKKAWGLEGLKSWRLEGLELSPLPFFRGAGWERVRVRV